MLAIGGELYKEPGKLPFKLTTGEYPLYRTVGKEARPGHVEFYDKEGNTLIDQDCRVRPAGPVQPGHAAKDLQGTRQGQVRQQVF